MARPPSDIRARIITSARGVFLQKGVDGASLRQIAKDAGTNIGMVYYYFETKDVLFLQVVEDRYAGVLKKLEEIFARDAPLLERMTLASASIGDLEPEEFEVMRIVLGELVRSTPERKKLVMDRFKQGHVGLLLRSLTEASGEIDPRHPVPVALISIVGAMVLPQLLLRMAGEATPIALPEPGVLAESLADVLRHGLLKEED